MKINKETALSLWHERYGDKQEVKDYAGRLMSLSAYDNRSSSLGFNIDHIFPTSLGGTNDKENLIICNILTNDEKANKTTFKANSKSFQVRKIKGSRFHKIVRIDNEKNDSNKNNNDDDSIFSDNPNVKNFWVPKFGKVVSTHDFTNRPINVNHFCTNDPDSWTYIKANPSVALSENNYLIVNKKIASLIEGKNKFTIDDISYEIIKNNNGIYSVYCEDKLNIYKPEDMLVYYRSLQNKKEWKTHLCVKNNNPYYNNDVFFKLFTFTKKTIDLYLNSKSNISNCQINDKGDFIISFMTPTKQNIKDVVEISVILNSYFSNMFNNIDYIIFVTTTYNNITDVFNLSYYNNRSYYSYNKTIIINDLAYNNAIKDDSTSEYAKKTFYSDEYEYNVINTTIDDYFNK